MLSRGHLRCAYVCIVCVPVWLLSAVGQFSSSPSVSMDYIKYKQKQNLPCARFPNVSITLEWTCVFKTWVTAELTVIFLWLLPSSWLLRFCPVPWHVLQLTHFWYTMRLSWSAIHYLKLLCVSELLFCAWGPNTSFWGLWFSLPNCLSPWVCKYRLHLSSLLFLAGSSCREDHLPG